MALVSQIRIEIDGEEIKDFLNLRIKQNIYGPNEFEVLCRLDTFEDKDGFVLDQSKKFIGSGIVISIDVTKHGKTDSSDGLLFKGLITGVRGEKSGLSHNNRIFITGHSPDILLCDNPGSYSYTSKNLKQIADDVLKSYPRDVLKSTVKPQTNDQLDYTVRYNENTYQFLRRLATRYGEWFFYNGTELVFGALPGSNVDLSLGTDQTDFSFGINLQPINFNYRFYDSSKATPIESASTKSAGKNQLNEIGGYAHDKSVKHFSNRQQALYSHLNVAPGNYIKHLRDVVELEESAQALGMSSVKGSSQNPLVKLGIKANIKAIKTDKKSDVDYGEYIITSVTHQCDNMMNYQNTFEGISGNAKIPDYTDPWAIIHCEAQSAVVTDNKDPEKQGRIKVNLFWQEKSQSTPWLRIINPYSGNGRGFYFIPEVDDEVLVGFEGGDAEKPYVVGSLYHGKNKPHTGWPENKNSFKGIVTQSNLRIGFDDNKKITTIDTPGGNKIVISDDEKSILLSDQNNNTVELKPDGIFMDSPKNISLKSKSKILIDAASGIEITSKADLKASAMNTEIKADMNLKAEGGMNAELKSALVKVEGSATATIKGGMVMIN